MLVGRADGLYATCNVFYRRDAYDAAGGFDPEIGKRWGFRIGRRARGLGFGEDAMLGWAVRRHGEAGFAADASVQHHVFPPDLMESLSRASMAGAFPFLVREIPELRDLVLWKRVFLTKSRIVLYCAVIVVLARRRRLAALLAAYWTSQHYRRLAFARPPAEALRLLPASLLIDVVTAVALVTGSVQARTPVL
jgi:hypothetical protein